MTHSLLSLALACIAGAANAQWSGPASGVLSTGNTVLISKTGGGSTCYGCPPIPPLFSTRLTGLPVIGGGSSTVYPFYVSYEGRVGVGTDAPRAALDVRGSLVIGGNAANPISLQTGTMGNLTINTDGYPVGRGLFIKSPSGDIFKVTPEQLLFTNGTDDFMKVDDQGRLFARKVIVTVTNPFPDYVFSKGYSLMPLKELASYISTHKHLPNIKSAADIAAANKQLELGEMQLKLLEKVEELTLYILQQQKEIDALKEQLNP